MVTSLATGTGLGAGRLFSLYTKAKARGIGCICCSL